MEDERETYSRIRRLEDATEELAKSDKQLNETVNELVIQSKLMGSILERMSNSLEPRIAKLEEDNFQLKMEQSANSMVITAVKWLAGVVVLGGLTTVGSFILKGAGIGL